MEIAGVSGSLLDGNQRAEIQRMKEGRLTNDLVLCRASGEVL